MGAEVGATEESFTSPPLNPVLEELPSHRMIRAEVDLSALAHNVEVLRGYANGAELMGVVKADAYGHGLVPVTRALAHAGVKQFAVANVQEGIELRQSGLDWPILVLSAPLSSSIPVYAQHGLRLTVSSLEIAKGVAEAASPDAPLVVHVKVDTGIHRLGIASVDVPETLDRLDALPDVTVEGIWTHCATVHDDFVYEQLGRFDEMLGGLETCPRAVHVSNSGTLLYVPEASKGRSVVRVGGALYGLIADPITGSSEIDLRPVMRLVSKVVHTQVLQPGETVSYGRTWTAERETRIATVAAGYGDGFLRALSNRGDVGIHGVLFPIIGRVCMDMLMVDLGPPQPAGKLPIVSAGDDVVLFGPGGPSAEETAVAADTLVYELTCGLTARVPKVYHL